MQDVMFYRTLGLGIVLCAMVACSSSDKQVEHRIFLEVAKGPGTVIRMAQLTPFPWERLFVFPPYASPEQMNQELGFAWSEGVSTGIDEDDGHTLLVFVHDARVIAYDMHPRDHGDFSELHVPEGYPPDTAIFVVNKSDDGRLVVEKH